ncbi:MAG: hydroxymethylbilane synthase [Gammaproteobacteria bacterium]|jgi:hydroxymethylbilane synthase
MKLRIATRNSQLALWQTDFVIAQLQKLYPDLVCEKVELLTQGDKNLSTSLAKIGGKGLFLKELEQALLQNQADIAVHSLKDVPAQLTEGLELITFLARENPSDVLLSQEGVRLMQLPKGAIVGTSSLRRQCQLKSLRPDLNFEWLRGNVPTRVKKLQNKEYDAIVLAYAGLKRLNLQEQISETLTTCLPAVGQGVIVIQSRLNDKNMKKLCAPLDDLNTRICITAERAMHAYLGGSCQTPIAGLATLQDNQILLQGLVGAPDGSHMIRGNIKGAKESAAQLGEQLAQQLIDQGADKILNACKTI